MGDAIARWFDKWFVTIMLAVIMLLMLTIIGVMILSISSYDPRAATFYKTCEAQGNIPAFNGREWVCMENPNHAR